MSGNRDEWAGRLTAGLKESESWGAQDLDRDQHRDQDQHRVPDLAWFESLVSAHRRQLRRKWRRELAAFLLAAVCLVGGALFLFARSPQLFVTIQIALAAAGALPWIYTRYRERRAKRR